MKCLIVGGCELRKVSDKDAEVLVANGNARYIPKEKYDLMIQVLNKKEVTRG